MWGNVEKKEEDKEEEEDKRCCEEEVNRGAATIRRKQRRHPGGVDGGVWGDVIHFFRGGGRVINVLASFSHQTIIEWRRADVCSLRSLLSAKCAFMCVFGCLRTEHLLMHVIYRDFALVWTFVNVYPTVCVCVWQRELFHNKKESKRISSKLVKSNEVEPLQQLDLKSRMRSRLSGCSVAKKGGRCRASSAQSQTSRLTATDSVCRFMCSWITLITLGLSEHKDRYRNRLLLRRSH